jgi:hypothetical protein
MSLIDLPLAVIGGALRLARLPLDLVFGSTPDGAAARPAPPSQPEEQHPSETAEQRQQAEALQRAVNGQL